MTTMPANPTPAEGVVVPLPCPFCGNTNAAPFLDDTQGMKWGSAMCPECSARGPEVRTAYDTSKKASWRTEAIEEWNARPAAPTQSAAQTGEVERLRAALKEISEIEPKPFDGGLDLEAIRACEECQRYAGHPVQQGICNTHRRPIWDREKHETHEERVLGYRAKRIAREALSQPEPSR